MQNLLEIQANAVRRHHVSRAVRIALATCLALAPLWMVTMFGRGLWTPDEPREADISLRMATQTNRAIPLLAGEQFLEKPPLTYWAAGWAAALFPQHDAALRAPNLLYASIASAAIALLAFEAGGTTVAWMAGIVSGSFALALQVASWLATDAALMSGIAVALLGFFRGFRAERGRQKLGWYCLMHAGLAWAFMAKGPGAWLVPALAAASFVALERRWSELQRWELWTGLAIPLCVIGAWAACVARSPDGKHALLVMLWDNVAGRALTLHAADAIAYSKGHRNWPGKYLVEFPLYTIPWTFLLAAAVRRSWSAARGADGSPWRFALCVLVPPMIVLSLASTARGIYAAPLLPGAALLIGLWFRGVEKDARPLDLRMVKTTVVFVATIAAVLFAVMALILSSDSAAARAWVVAVGGAAVTASVLLAAWRNLNRRDWARTMQATFAAYLLAFLTMGLVAFPALDRWHDLPSLVRAMARDAGTRPMAIYAADETLTAVADSALTQSGRAVSRADSVEAGRTLLAQTNAPVFIVALPGRGDGPVLRRLRALGVHISPPAPSPLVEELTRQLGLSVERVYELPQGRRYALLSRRSTAVPSN